MKMIYYFNVVIYVLFPLLGMKRALSLFLCKTTSNKRRDEDVMSERGMTWHTEAIRANRNRLRLGYAKEGG